MAIDDDPRSPTPDDLNDLVVRCLERLEREGQDGLEAFCREHAAEAEIVRRRILRLQSTGMLGDSLDPTPGTLGEFRLIEVIGRGGMGVVYRAEQTSLGRIVAVKVVRTDGATAPAHTRERFLREIEAATRLAHPNVVQIFSAGTEDGVPYFAMEHVDGVALSVLMRAFEQEDPALLHGRDLRRALEQELAGGSRDWNDAFFARDWQAVVLDVVEQVASAIVHAHERGVWHRDLKPSNVMLTAAGHVKVVDFGLASLRGASRMTASGSPLGSLPYLAPEALEGTASDLTPAADVYGMGVLMYELLTLELPYWDKTPERLIQRILHGPMRSPRILNRALDRNVAIVCERALAPELAVRYPDPRSLRDDLRALVRGEDVSSRAPGPWRRTRRWARRHPARASVILSAIVLLVMVGFLVRERVERDSGAERSAAARSAAHRSVRDLLDLSQTDLAELPATGDLARLRSVDAAIEMWRPYYEATPDDAETSLTWARLHVTRANTLRDSGRARDACSEYDAALSILSSEASRSPNDPAIARDVASILHGLAIEHLQLDRAQHALALLKEAVALFRRLEEEAPENERDACNRVTAEAFQADLAIRCGEHSEARAALESCVSRARACRERWPESGEVLEAASRALLGLATLEQESGRAADAERLAREGLAGLARMPLQAPNAASLRDVEARLLETCAIACRATGDAAEGDRQLESAIESTEALVASFPHWPVQRRNLASLLNRKATHDFERGDFEAGWQATDRAGELMEALVAECPDVTMNGVILALVRTNVAHSLLASDPQDAAWKAQEILDQSFDPVPQDPGSLLWGVGVTCAVTVARGMTAVDDLDAAEEALHHWAPSLLRQDPWHHRLFADAWNEWILGVRRSPTLEEESRRLMEEDGTQRMFDLLEAAVDLGYRDLHELNTTPSLDSFRRSPRFVRLLERAAR